MIQGRNFGSTYQWMKDDVTMITCYSDGLRPVIFKLEMIEREQFSISSI